MAGLVTASMLGSVLVLYWLVGLLFVILADQWAHRGLLARVNKGEATGRMPRLLAWTAMQSAYGNALAALLWFSPLESGKALAALYLCGSLANAAGTLRHSPALAAAAMTPTAAFLLGLPVAEFLLTRQAVDLFPLVGGLLLLAWGVKLWNSLLASDAALAHAEASAMRERQAAASAAAAKSDMINRVNDELRTPLAALAGVSEYLRRAAATPSARELVASLAHANEVLRQALEDVSDLSRREDEQLQFVAQQADPRQIARSVVAAFRTAADDKGIELFLDMAADVPATVEIDPVRVRQILFNLVANAVSFTTYGGVRIRVSASPSERERRIKLVFSIADTGAGMSRSHLAIILGRGRTPDASESDASGLSAAVKLARLMGGEITAKSELGEGSLFTFALDAPVVAVGQSRSAA